MAYVGQTGGCRGLEGLSLDTLFANVVPKTATYAELGDKAGLLSLAAKPTERWSLATFGNRNKAEENISSSSRQAGFGRNVVCLSLSYLDVLRRLVLLSSIVWTSIIGQLNNVFEKSWQSGGVPGDWKKGTITCFSSLSLSLYQKAFNLVLMWRFWLLRGFSVEGKDFGELFTYTF